MGAGKSDLALRLIDRGAVLISDDRTMLVRVNERLVARAPERMAGCIEVRGLGVMTVPHVDAIPVALIVTLGEEEQRMPERRARDLAGVKVRELALASFRASTPLKVEWAVRHPDLPPA